MKRQKATKIIASILATVLAASTLTACGGGSEYNGYASAYNKVTANGGMEAKFDVDLTMDGEKVESEGDFKLDTSGDANILYYEMTTGENDIIQFSDGEYIYTDMGDSKSMYKLGTKPSGGDSGKEETKGSTEGFSTNAFLNEFSSFLEAGKIKELGLLSPIEKAAISSIKKEGDTYVLTFSDALVKKYLNTLVQNETGKDADETIQIDELNDFTYKATEKDGMLTGVQYTGVLKVNVPGSLLDGEDKTYDLDMDINITFVNPGEKVSIELPSTDGFTEVK